MPTPIPAVWRIDVEPDDNQPDAHTLWNGFVATADLVDNVRDRLADRSGHVVHPTWLLRLDPDIERSFGRADFVVRRHADVFERLVGHQDPLGIHVHPHRWDVERCVGFSDHADTEWTTHCVRTAARVFAECFGEPVRRSSQGGYFMSESIVDTLIALGIEVDVTAEPGLAPKNADPSFGAYSTAPSGDFRDCPRRPYYPSRGSFSVPSSSIADSRPILIVPLTAYDYETDLATWPHRVDNALKPRHHTPLNPWKQWPSPGVYWDLVARAMDEQSARYVAFAIRTDSPGSISYEGARALLEYLPHHPLGERLQFVDPLGPEIGALAMPQDS